jgi:2-polyprenyl-3-methyl-5-hydroxy-6-metoxy-1,4-benzoquinol methylase
MRLPADWRRPEAAQAYQLFRCARDAYGQVWPLPSPAEIAAAYEVSDYYTHEQEAEPGGASTQTFLERLRFHLAWRADSSDPLTAESVQERFPARPLKICEIGCGNATLLAALARLGHDVQGVEPDPQARAVASQQGLRVEAGTAESLPASLPLAAFDLVLINHVLEHCRDPLAALQAAKALLKPQGTLICEVPNNEARGLRSLGAAWLWLDVPRHLHFFSERSLHALFAQAGLTIQRTAYDGYCRQFSTDWIQAERSICATFRRLDPSFSSSSRPWRLLLSTLFASPALKYDSVRVEARPS